MQFIIKVSSKSFAIKNVIRKVKISSKKLDRFYSHWYVKWKSYL